MEPTQRSFFNPRRDVLRVWLRRDTAQIIATGTQVPIQWVTAIEDNANFWNVQDPSKLVVKRPGLYVFSAGMQWDGNASGTYRHIFMLKNGVTNLGASGQVPSAAGLAQRTPPITSPALTMLGGDYVQLIALHDMGADRNLDNGLISGYSLQLF